MSKRLRTFTPEFKREAASLVLDQGYNQANAAQSIGLVESALRWWVNQLQQERSCATPTSKALTPEQQKPRNWKPESTARNKRNRFKQGHRALDGRGTRVLALVDQFRSQESVDLLCSVSLKPTRACYYAYCRRRRTPDAERVFLRSRVHELFTQSRSAAGSRSIMLMMMKEDGLTRRC